MWECARAASGVLCATPFSEVASAAIVREMRHPMSKLPPFFPSHPCEPSAAGDGNRGATNMCSSCLTSDARPQRHHSRAHHPTVQGVSYKTTPVKDRLPRSGAGMDKAATSACCTIADGLRSVRDAGRLRVDITLKRCPTIPPEVTMATLRATPFVSSGGAPCAPPDSVRIKCIVGSAFPKPQPHAP